jgi:hypothetical protein
MDPRESVPFAVQPALPGWTWSVLAGLTAVMVGVGSVGSLVAAALLSLGVRKFVLLDPKKFRRESVVSQCEESEVDELKVRAVARRLRRLYASVVALPLPVEFLEPGWAGPDSIVVSCTDTKAGQRAANRLALAMRRPLFRVNLEPRCLAASVTYMDFSRPDVPVCLECGWDGADYKEQSSAASCDGMSGGRPTGAPRALSALTAAWGGLTIASALASEKAGERLSGSEYIFGAMGPSLTRTVLPGNPGCLAPQHGRRGPLVRLSETPASVSFESLAARSNLGGGKLRISGSGQLSLRCRCAGCGRVREGARWWRNPLRPVGRCGCGARLFPDSFESVTSWSREEAASVWSAPLSSLRVGRKAVVTFSAGDDEVNYVLR